MARNNHVKRVPGTVEAAVAQEWHAHISAAELAHEGRHGGRGREKSSRAAGAHRAGRPSGVRTEEEHGCDKFAEELEGDVQREAEESVRRGGGFSSAKSSESIADVAMTAAR